ncbi:TPA: hypothetical protein DCZ46_02685 [Candidatus Campbellbacteria bacterium]|nr:MAG: hypothetical protein UR58_C0001G0515 [Candidatus Campbellbacteria bacterium GW2011_OD1_34_28]KKP74965.1 MAG: hypothetical protein UR74_C0002G0231 [Candidatus Campbellbacteria bacterium GW2011_GWD2_35_24]KKP75851.1 MAG: hypothetical protein UR75_C0002G0232 [Candidatus Campbellbacteria bacterium GW2011_GWC2_35_28]KKP76901.1 MAG: hypothetical protein UR76_C0002G0102 [Candidatus Campbellbacteria bacterium GW2011_GWC1_35_31]KKP78827.1 MAG: hypothetical protein UR79_C0002G0102 [Candidatus Cam
MTFQTENGRKYDLKEVAVVRRDDKRGWNITHPNNPLVVVGETSDPLKIRRELEAKGIQVIL